VYVERNGRLQETNVRFKDQAHVRMIIDRIVSNIDGALTIRRHCRCASRRRLACLRRDSSAIADRSVLSIRRFGKKLLSTEDLLKNETLTTGMLDYLSGCVEARLNVVISGGSGAARQRC